MDDILKAYELEIARLRLLSGEFARRYPKVAGKLQIAGDGCEDPHVERLIESVALIAARISTRLDDDYPQLTERLLDVLHPHYTRPFPSCTIVRFDRDSAGADAAPSIRRVARGSIVDAAPVQGVQCRFRTAYEVIDSPVNIGAATFNALIKAPAAVQLPVAASSSIDIEIDNGAGIALAAQSQLRLFIDGEASFGATLLDTLFMRVVCAHVELDDGRWLGLPAIPLRRVGLSEDEALIPFGAQSHRAYRVLTEYFAFPEKFNFFDIDLGMLLQVAGPACKKLTLHLGCAGVRADSNVARMLRGLSAACLVPGCTPVVNLFAQPGVPIAVSGLTVDYPVLAHAQRPYGYEVYSIDSVHMVRQSAGASAPTECRPFYSLRHGEDAASTGHYWVMRHDQTVAAISPGFEKRITLVDTDLTMLAKDKSALSLMLSCTNRDLPTRLRHGQPEGDLKLLNGGMHAPIRFLRRPSPSYRFASGNGEYWRLISHLTLNHHSLVQEGLEALREMLTLYDLPQSATSQRLIKGITSLDYADSATWMRRKLGPCLVHGIEVRITIDEEAFVGSGVHIFIEVMDQFLGLYVQHNSFVQLRVLSQQTGEEIKQCKPRNGYQQLV
ncbi:type VI secretion system baseplate subunit TssF [Massilia sp. PWRC2]|uniref:type VI secretion system baseplate subunit TssF n=1 Tax=Massilia sp. PWRC2 TaxID=2804626 RepID=UPI003CF3D1E4